MKTILTMAALAATFASAAVAAVRWQAEPTRQEVAAAEPAEARGKGSGGRAVIRCRLTTAGETSGCVILRETPTGLGYGRAGLELAKRYRAAPQAGETIVELPFDWFRFDTQPDWLKKPTADDLAAVWPTAAWKKGKGGAALLNCTITVRGLLTDCVVLDESPPGENFGGAAIALSPQLMFKPARLKGEPVPSTINLPVTFKAVPGMNQSMSMQSRLAPVVQGWLQAPSYADMVAAYPAKAKAEKVGGRATVSCDVKKDGRLAPCLVMAETPKGQGFGKAARELAKGFLMNTIGPDGKAQDNLAVQLPFAFDPKMLETPIVGKPSWIAVPPAEDFTAAFGALKLEASARAQLDCLVKPDGFLTDCKVAAETPAGTGVGAAALQVAPKFKLSTWTNEGLPVAGGRVRVPLRYDP